MSRHRENKGDIILQAAQEEFLEKGFDGARTVDIAKRAGFTHAMLHYYYNTKEELFEQVVARIFVIFKRSVVDSFLDESTNLRERVRNGIARHFDFIAENPLLPRFLLCELPRHKEFYPMFRNYIIPQLSSMKEYISGEIAKSNPDNSDVSIKLFHYFFDIISMNVASVMTAPIIEGISDIDPQQFISDRKEHILSMLDNIPL